MPKRILYWFRNDLRLHDNDGFARALEAADEVLPVFVFEPRWFDELPSLGFRKTGIYRSQFLLESVADLRRSLRARGADLIIRVGHSTQLLAQLAEDIGAEAIYASKEVTQEETDTESDLSKRLKPINIDLELFWNATLYYPRDLPFWVSRLPNSFSQFRTEIESKSTIRPPIPTPVRVSLVSGIDSGELPTLESFGFSDEEIRTIIKPDTRAGIHFEGGETAGLQRLQYYIWEKELIKTYKDTRNSLIGEAYSSKFSAWLSMGCLSPRLIYQEIKRFEAERIQNESTYWLIFELIWRDFFRFVALRYGTRIFKPSGIRLNLNKVWLNDSDLFKKWTQGQTGIPFVDANMRELNATGFMSNRGRQNVSSFLINDLGINWTWGASYFESLLVDYDPCTNWGNWNYLAGVGNDPREHRYFNIYSQSVRYDEQGAYVKHWLPELANVPAELIHSVYKLSSEEQDRSGILLGETYPLPVINPNKWTVEEKNR